MEALNYVQNGTFFSGVPMVQYVVATENRYPYIRIGIERWETA